jgi:protease-4
MLSEIRSILAGPSIQARCLECATGTPARLDERDLSLLQLLKGWLS